MASGSNPDIPDNTVVTKPVDNSQTKIVDFMSMLKDDSDSDIEAVLPTTNYTIGTPRKLSNLKNRDIYARKLILFYM